MKPLTHSQRYVLALLRDVPHASATDLCMARDKNTARADTMRNLMRTFRSLGYAEQVPADQAPDTLRHYHRITELGRRALVEAKTAESAAQARLVHGRQVFGPKALSPVKDTPRPVVTYRPFTPIHMPVVRPGAADHLRIPSRGV